MSTLTMLRSPVVELTAEELHAAALRTLRDRGLTYATLARFAESDEFPNLTARMTWQAVRGILSPTD